MLGREWARWAAVACGILAGCGGGGAGGTGGSTTTSSTGTTTTPPPACGDGNVDPEEACDDANLAAGDGCDAFCAVETGYTCTGSPSACATTGGDGVVAGDEACDDGNTTPGDGCDATCAVEDGYTCDGAPSACVTTCGDGILAGAEVCDDGNTDADDGCDAACAVEAGFTCDMASPTICAAICGDGSVVGAETCDDNNTTDADGCSADCTTVENGWTCTGSPSACVTTCGDGIIAGAEECDDSNATDGDGCSAACGIENGWVCTGEPSICATVCGDNTIAGAEVCDDGNAIAGDGCATDCLTVEAGWTCAGTPSACATVCGDGVIAGVEVCDDGNAVGGDGCAAACSGTEPGWICAGMPTVCMTTCGDSIIAGAENCDDGNAGDGDGCSSACVAEPGYICSGTPSVCATVCGDGLVGGSEACDDFNTSGGDGCSANCSQVELGFTCSGAPSVCLTTCGDGLMAGGETCDDGNTVDGDGCSSACTPETGYTCSGSPSVCGPLCGDGIVIQGEKCDDGNITDGDCCSSTCQLEPGCEVEPNDTIATANDFVTLASGNAIKGVISVSTDKDVFKITVPAGYVGNFVLQTLAVTGGPACVTTTGNLASTITVFNAGGTSVGTDTISGPGNCSLLTVLGLVPGDYFIEVKKGTTSTGAATFPYLLQADVTLSVCGNSVTELGEQCDDGNGNNGDGCTSGCKLEPTPETEPNNTCGATANGPFPMPPNLLVSGNVNVAGDSDWYALTISNYVDLKLETFDENGPGFCATGHDTKIQAFNGSCAALGASDDDGGIGNCSLLDPALSTQTFMRHLAPGTYYVNVFPYSSTATFPYTLLATFSATCGNGVKEGSEICDGGPFCGPDCTLIPACGNGAVESGETCDDGNNVDGDGCNATCAVEPGYLCSSDSPSVCSQQEGNCNDGLDNDGDGQIDAADSDCAFGQTLMTPCGAGQTLLVFNSVDIPKIIADADPVGAQSRIPVSFTGTVMHAAILLDIAHTYTADVDISLLSPGGSTLDISSDNGSSGDNYTFTTFEDGCTPVTSGSPPYSGCFSPEQALSTVNGQSATGVWTLKAVDDLGGIAGVLNSWSLALCVQ